MKKSKNIWVRRDRALALHKSGRSFREIGEELGVSAGRASELARMAAKLPPSKRFSPLSDIRVQNCLQNAGFDEPYDVKAIKGAILEGRFNPRKIKNYGSISHNALCRFLKIPTVLLKPKVRKAVVESCPRCHGTGKIKVHRYI